MDEETDLRLSFQDKSQIHRTGAPSGLLPLLRSGSGRLQNYTTTAMAAGRTGAPLSTFEAHVASD